MFQKIVFLLYHPEITKNNAPIIKHLFVQPIQMCQISGHPKNLFSTKKYSCWNLVTQIISIHMCMYVYALLLRTKCNWTSFMYCMDTFIPLSLLLLTIILWGRYCQDVIPKVKRWLTVYQITHSKWWRGILKTGLFSSKLIFHRYFWRWCHRGRICLSTKWHFRITFANYKNSVP